MIGRGHRHAPPCAIVGEHKRPPPKANPTCAVVRLSRSSRGGLAGLAAREKSLSGQDCQSVGDQLLACRPSPSPSCYVPRVALSALGATVRLPSLDLPSSPLRVEPLYSQYEVL
jgi:hypothetical protein